MQQHRQPPEQAPQPPQSSSRRSTQPPPLRSSRSHPHPLSTAAADPHPPAAPPQYLLQPQHHNSPPQPPRLSSPPLAAALQSPAAAAKKKEARCLATAAPSPAAAAAAQSPAATCSPLLLRQSSLPHLRPSPLAIKIFNYEGISFRPRLPVHHLIRALRPPQTPMDRPRRYESGAPECILTNLPRGKRHAHNGYTSTIEGPGPKDVVLGTPGGIAAAILNPPVFPPLDMCLRLCY